MKRVMFEPEFLEQVGEVRWKSEAEKRRIIKNKNISIFHSYVYQAMFGGRVCKQYKGDVEKILVDFSRNFHPDIIKTTRAREIFTEIKSMADEDPRPQCPYKQLENYSWHTLREDRHRELTSFDYAFFKYKLSKKSLDLLSNADLEEYLTKNTMELIILPPNLLFTLFARSERKSRNQESNKGPDIALYFRPRISDMRRLAKDNGAETKLAEDYRVKDFIPFLALDNIQCKIYESPILYSHKHKINPFRIVHYFNSDEGVWTECFRKNHEALLKEMLGVRDIYADTEPVPF